MNSEAYKNTKKGVKTKLGKINIYTKHGDRQRRKAATCVKKESRMSKLIMDPNRRAKEREGRRGVVTFDTHTQNGGGAACGSPAAAHSNKNMRNLDNQMMLYFSDKSLIFKLYYYVLVNTNTQRHAVTKNGILQTLH